MRDGANFKENKKESAISTFFFMFHVYGRLARENVENKIITPLDPPPAPGNVQKNTTLKKASRQKLKKRID
jgi:hypothetical protein